MRHLAFSDAHCVAHVTCTMAYKGCVLGGLGRRLLAVQRCGDWGLRAGVPACSEPARRWLSTSAPQIEDENDE